MDYLGRILNMVKTVWILEGSNKAPNLNVRLSNQFVYTSYTDAKSAAKRFTENSVGWKWRPVKFARAVTA